MRAHGLLKALDSSDLKGRNVKVNEAKPRAGQALRRSGSRHSLPASAAAG